MSEPIKAEVFAWERREPAVDYTFANGEHEAHRIGMEDWAILLRLERAGKLSFRDDRIRQRFQLIKPSSDDPSAPSRSRASPARQIARQAEFLTTLPASPCVGYLSFPFAHDSERPAPTFPRPHILLPIFQGAPELRLHGQLAGRSGGCGVLIWPSWPSSASWPSYV